MKQCLIMILSIFLIGCTPQSTPPANSNDPVLETHENITLDAGFDTFVDLRAATYTQEEFDELFDVVITRFSSYNEYFDIYNDYAVNNVKTINDNAGIEPVEVSQEIIDMLLLSKEFYELTDGEFDVTIGAILKIWHEYREKGLELNKNGELADIPTQEELENVKGCVGWNHIFIDDDKNTVYIDDPCVSLDVGGVAKGYATELAAQYVEDEGITMAILNAGGNNRTVHSKPDGTPWNVGIQNPDDNGSIMIVSAKDSMSFVTSGDYQRFFVGKDGKVYSHIIDPKTLYPAINFRSVSIITQNSAIADILSTSLYTLDYESGLNLIKRVREAYPQYTFDAVWLSDEPLEGFKRIGKYYYNSTEDESDVIKVNQVN